MADATLAQIQTCASRVVAACLQGRALDENLIARYSEGFDAKSRAALQDAAYGVLRYLGELRALLRHLSEARKLAPELESLLWVALYQLRYGRSKDFVVVSQAVSAAEGLGHARAKPLVNALLRRHQRERAALDERLLADNEARYNLPAWWLKRLREDYPAEWQALALAGQSKPPMSLRVNVRRSTRDAVASALTARGLDTITFENVGLRLATPVPVSRLPELVQGHVSVQDAGAQFAAALVNAAPGERVLDACAAPGGKAAHIAEQSDVSLTALDVEAARCASMREGFSRLGLAVDTRHADACDTQSWWDGKPFDKILIDAPCSGSGVIRRHPDGKWLKRERDLVSLNAVQSALLEALWPLLRPGGRLLYVTCSVFRCENEGRIEPFLTAHRDAERCNFALPGETVDGCPGQLLPGGAAATHNHDGLFYALLQKRPS